MIETDQMIPLTDFAEAMRARADDSFATRVDEFEAEFGKTDDDTLAVLAQAAYYCWGNYHYRDNLLHVCAAIGSGRPTCMYLHAQVSPQRWAELNAYVVGVQRWLNPHSFDIPDGVDLKLVAAIAHWLGESTSIKRILVSLFLNELVPNLTGMNLSKLGSPDYADTESFQDFTHWYGNDEGKIFGDNRKECSAHCVQALSADPQFCGDIKEIVTRTMEEKPHSCMHRFARHLDIQLSSIGVLKWRGDVPPCKALSKKSWIEFIEKDCGVRSWSDGRSPVGEYASTVHATIGTLTDQKRVIVDKFLCAQDRGSTYSGGWIGEQSRIRGRNVRQLFRIDET